MKRKVKLFENSAITLHGLSITNLSEINITHMILTFWLVSNVICRDGNWTQILWAPAKNIRYEVG